jgi:hypothetical protein
MNRATLSRILALLLLPAVALSQPPPVSGPVPLQTEAADEELAGGPLVRLGVAIFGTAGTFKMNDLNATISDLTPIARDQWGAPEITLDPIEGGIGYGGGVTALFRQKYLVALDYERLTGKSEVGGQLGSSLIEVPATAILATVGWAFHSGSGIQVGVAAGLGRYESDMTADFIVDEEVVQKIALTGNGLGQHYTMWVDSPALGKFRIFTMFGYRRAVIDDVTLEVDFPDPVPPAGLTFPFDAEGNELDWSGFMGRAALAYTFGL